MADCSAAGTTIDRATRAVFGASNEGQEAAKHVGALLGNAATMGHGAAMPMSSPQFLSIPNGQRSQVPATVKPASSPQMARMPPSQVGSSAQMEAAWNTQASHRVGQPQHGMPHPHQMMNSPQMMHLQQQQQQQQQQQAMHAMMMQQQHQQHMMQQHLQMLNAQQQQQQQQQQQKSKVGSKSVSQKTSKELNAQKHDDLNDWHKGLEKEVERQGLEDAVAGHDGIVHGASIEELAAAWAQAEAEYDKLTENEEDPSNLFRGDPVRSEPRPYEFMHKDEPAEKMNWMEEGMKQFREGNLKEAVRSFEMELQHNNLNNATAWRMLGRCHAENDMDPEAIKCLEAAVDRDPFSPETLLALGVSYVNELNHEKALENMKAWFTHNPKYAGMEIPTDIYAASSAKAKESGFEEVKKLLLSALEFDATDAGDVYEALGVIYNVIKDYDAAAESLRKAIDSRPDDYQLWNKLGATLANGNHSDQALPAYHQALQLKPKYARAWLNMAISHSNLQNHDEAARCYLQTLSLNPGANHCWTYLRMALSCNERWDLLPLVFDQNLAAFKEHFDFVLYD